MTSTARSPDAATRVPLDRSSLRNLPAAVVFTAQGLLLVIALALVGRSIAGAFSRPTPGLTIVAAIVVCAIAGAIRLWLVLGSQYVVRTISVSRPMFVRTILLFASPGLTALLTLLAVSAAGSSTFALASAWLIFLVIEAASWLLVYRLARPSSAAQSLRSRPPLRIDSADSLAPDAVQQLTRTRDESGIETIEALVRVNFSERERLQVVHLAFCPPLANIPSVALEQVEGPEAELRTTTVQTFGTRIEVRLVEENPACRSAVVQIYAATEASSDHLP